MSTLCSVWKKHAMGSEDGLIDTKLHEAVRFSQTENVKKALQQGYDPNLIGLYQWSPLHEAAYNGDKKILQMLLQKKGDPNKQDFQRSRTATHYAAENGHVECLKMLIDAGAKYSIKDADGKDCLDVVTPGGRKLLERLKVRDLMLKPDDCALDDKDEGISTDPSHDQVSSVTTSRRSSIVSQQENGPVLGYLHLSVEYHAAKGSLKIRVWQLSDLLLPPPNTSMIHSIYVKSYLQPDKKRESKRKTEEVKVDSSKGHIHWRKKKEISIKHVFTPASFKFSQPLEYSGVTGDIVKWKQLEMEVCVTQRYTHRSFLIGMVRMSLRSAVRKLKKEKFPLIPCMNHTIPSNMKVYCASELNIVNNSPGGNYFFSNPNVRIVLPEDTDDASERAASNPDLQPWQQQSPSTEVDMNLQFQNVPFIPNLDLNSLPLDESGYSSEFHISVPGELESPDSDSSKNSFVKLHGKNAGIANVSDLKKASASLLLDNIKEQDTAKGGEGRTDVKLQVDDSTESDLGEVLVDRSMEDVKKSVQHESETKQGKKSDEDSGSRPETPTWDYYDIPTEVVSQEVEESTSPWKEGAAPVVLPMETTLGIANSKDQNVIQPIKKDKSLRRSKKKSAVIPGKAVPVVPSIVVTRAENDLGSQSKTKISGEKTDNNNIPNEIMIESKDSNTNDVNVEKGARPKIKPLLKKVDRKFFVNVDKAVGKDKTDDVDKFKSLRDDRSRLENEDSTPKAKPRLKKQRKMRESLVDEKKTVGKDKSSVPPLELVTKNQNRKSVQKEKENLNSGTGSTRTGSSVVVDIDKLSLSASGAHVVELIEDISITELAEDDQLFTDRSEASMSAFTDIESGLSDYRLPERVSPTKYMIPMQVYEVDDTSCDESMSCDNKSYIPTTEL